MIMRHPNIDLHVLRLLLVLSLTGLSVIGMAMARTDTVSKPRYIASPPDFILRLSADGASFSFSGVVDFGLTDALRRIVADHPDVKRIMLDSGGGYIAEARGAVTVLQAANIATHVEGHCASACALIFAGGATRTLAPDARLGLHGYALRRERHFGMIDPVAEMRRDLGIYRKQGVSESFLAQLADLPQAPMWYPPHPELRAAGMVTQP